MDKYKGNNPRDGSELRRDEETSDRGWRTGENEAPEVTPRWKNRCCERDGNKSPGRIER